MSLARRLNYTLCVCLQLSRSNSRCTHCTQSIADPSWEVDLGGSRGSTMVGRDVGQADGIQIGMTVVRAA